MHRVGVLERSNLIGIVFKPFLGEIVVLLECLVESLLCVDERRLCVIVLLLAHDELVFHRWDEENIVPRRIFVYVIIRLLGIPVLLLSFKERLAHLVVDFLSLPDFISRIFHQHVANHNVGKVLSLHTHILIENDFVLQVKTVLLF
jgi:hypothetical protein